MYSLVVAPQSRVRMVATLLPLGEVVCSKISSLQGLQPESPAKGKTMIENNANFKIRFKFTDDTRENGNILTAEARKCLKISVHNVK